MADDRKDLPSASATNWAQRVNETLRTYMGKAGPVLDRGVTIRDLVNAGIADLKGGSNFSGLKPGANIGQGAVGPQGPPGPAVPYEPDLTPPPTPTGFTAVAAISNILLEHAVPSYTQGHGHGRTRVYGATWTSGALPTFTAAVEITQFTGTVFAYATNPATTWHLWIKWESADGVLSTSPAGGTNGVAVTTGQDVSKLVAAMTGPGNPFKVVAVSTTLPDGSVVPAGTYTADAFIHNGEITNAKIANLAVDNAKIANLSVSKLTAGSIAVGQYIQSTSYVAGSSGWKMDGAGNLEASNAIVRGAIYASSGTFTGTVSASTINGSTFNGGTFTGGTFNSNVLNSVTVNGGIVNSITMNSMILNSGALNINSDGAGGWGYARSATKWWADGVNGWVLARHPTGPTFLDIQAGACRIYMSDGIGGGAGIQFPGITMTNGGLTISQVNVIDTLNLAGNAVTIPTSVYSASLISYIFTGVIQSLSFTSTGGPVFIIGACAAIDIGGAGGSIELRRDGVFLTSIPIGGAYNASAITYTDIPGAGAHTYTMNANNPGNQVNYTNRSLFTLETKR